MKIEAKRVSKRHPNRTEKPPKSSPKKHKKKERFWESAGAPLKCPGITPKQGTCPQRTPPETLKTTKDCNKIKTPTASPSTPGCLRPGADFVTFWGALGSHFGSQSGTKMASKVDEQLSDFWIAL